LRFIRRYWAIANTSPLFFLFSPLTTKVDKVFFLTIQLFKQPLFGHFYFLTNILIISAMSYGKFQCDREFDRLDMEDLNRHRLGDDHGDDDPDARSPFALDFNHHRLVIADELGYVTVYDTDKHKGTLTKVYSQLAFDNQVAFSAVNILFIIFVLRYSAIILRIAFISRARLLQPPFSYR
jgi:hypothetical protein